MIINLPTSIAAGPVCGGDSDGQPWGPSQLNMRMQTTIQGLQTLCSVTVTCCLETLYSPEGMKTKQCTQERIKPLRQGRCAAVTLMESHLALLPAMEPEVLEQLLAQQRSQGDAGPPQGIPRVLASTVGNAILIDLHKLGIRQVSCLYCNYSCWLVLGGGGVVCVCV